MRTLLESLTHTQTKIEQLGDVGMSGKLVSVQSDYATLFAEHTLMHYPFAHIKSVASTITEKPEAEGLPEDLTLPATFAELLQSLLKQWVKIENGSGALQGVLETVSANSVSLIVDTKKRIHYAVDKIQNISQLYQVDPSELDDTHPFAGSGNSSGDSSQGGNSGGGAGGDGGSGSGNGKGQGKSDGSSDSKGKDGSGKDSGSKDNAGKDSGSNGSSDKSSNSSGSSGGKSDSQRDGQSAKSSTNTKHAIMTTVREEAYDDDDGDRDRNNRSHHHSNSGNSSSGHGNSSHSSSKCNKSSNRKSAGTSAKAPSYLQKFCKVKIVDAG